MSETSEKENNKKEEGFEWPVKWPTKINETIKLWKAFPPDESIFKLGKKPSKDLIEKYYEKFPSTFFPRVFSEFITEFNGLTFNKSILEYPFIFDIASLVDFYDKMNRVIMSWVEDIYEEKGKSYTNHIFKPLDGLKFEISSIRPFGTNYSGDVFFISKDVTHKVSHQNPVFLFNHKGTIHFQNSNFNYFIFYLNIWAHAFPTKNHPKLEFFKDEFDKEEYKTFY
ncbi:MAG: hypothetical protein KDK36_13660 [Leptospiraceae bacterium]|nr:hypothetical protein [Leptospiraceae bacterium]